MTFILGVRRGGTAAIYADSQGSIDGKPQDHSTIKNGILFPGCIYGYSGNSGGARPFITKVRRALRGCGDINEAWSIFEKICERYSHDKPDFELLLSTRHTGTPIFYLYQAQSRRLIRTDSSICMLGTGVSLFGPVCERFHATAHLNSDGTSSVSPETYSYLTGALLNEMLSAWKLTHARDVEVGGIFSFYVQNEKHDVPQKPAMYVHLTVFCERREVSVTIQRVSIATHPRLGDLILWYEKFQAADPRWMLLLQNSTMVHFKRSEAEADWVPFYNSTVAEAVEHHPYHFLRVAVVGDPNYTVFFELGERETVYADLTGYVDDGLIRLLAGLHCSGELRNLYQNAGGLKIDWEGRVWEKPAASAGEVRVTRLIYEPRPEPAGTEE